MTTKQTKVDELDLDAKPVRGELPHLLTSPPDLDRVAASLVSILSFALEASDEEIPMQTKLDVLLHVRDLQTWAERARRNAKELPQ